MTQETTSRHSLSSRRARKHGPHDPSLSDHLEWSKNDFLTFCRESVKSAPNLSGKFVDLHGFALEEYGSPSRLPWGRLVLKHMSDAGTLALALETKGRGS